MRQNSKHDFDQKPSTKLASLHLAHSGLWQEKVKKSIRLVGKGALSGALALSVLGVSPSVIQAAEPGIEMFRLYNPNSGEHFYTANGGERDSLVGVGWSYEGVGWVAPEKGNPVYRLYNPNAGDHHYTMNSAERDMLVGDGWRYEGIGWSSDTGKKIPVYREYNPNAISGAHNYTPNLAEHQQLVKLGWRDEGIGWYAIGGGKPAPVTGLSRLHVSGTDLLDENNRKIVLQGYSTFGLNYAPQYVDENVFRFMKNQMHSQVIRLALYTEEYGGYCNGGDKAALEALIDKGVKAAKATGQYVIIDWHILSDGNPNTHLAEAKEFFNKMSARYRNEKHVFYEICNEPNGVSWDQVRSYAQQIIPVIRANDPNGVILVGTPTWSQDVDIAANAPLTGVSNVMYTLHFYAATHGEPIRQKLQMAHNKGLPVFVSEFGISSADGNGNLDPSSGQAWIDLLNRLGISRVGWAINNKNEASSLFLPGTSTALTVSDLSQSGRWFEEIYAKNYKPLPGQTATGSQPEEPSQPSKPSIPSQPSDHPASGQGLQKAVSLKNKWTSNGEDFYQYEIHLTNASASELSNWSTTVQFNHPVTVDQGWNGQYSVSGSQLTIHPVSYNQTLGAGQTLSDIGVIVKVPSSAGALSVQ